MPETFYDLLGVAPDASTEEIETAYREAIKETHPDVSDDADAGRRTKRLNEARAVLTDEDERAHYDRIGHEAYVGGATRDGSTDAPGPTDGSNSDQRDSSTIDQSGRSAGSRRRSQTSGSHHRRGGAEQRQQSDSGADASRDRATGRERAATGQARSGATAASASVDGGHGSRQAGNRSRSARRQAAAGTTAEPNVNASWNGWERTRAWAVRQGSDGSRGLSLERLFPPEQSIVLLGSAFLLYPLLVASALFPPFPILFRLVIAACMVFLLVYLFTMPEIALIVFGLWSALVTVGIAVLPAVSAVSIVGIVGLVATWLPLGLAALMLVVARP